MEYLCCVSSCCDGRAGIRHGTCSTLTLTRKVLIDAKNLTIVTYNSAVINLKYAAQSRERIPWGMG